MLYGQVADDAQPFAQRREVEGQSVGDVQRQRFRRKPLGEPRREVAVDLDRVQAAAARDQRGGERAARPGPISTRLSPGCGLIASTMRAT